MKYVRFENESDEALIYRVCKDKDIIGSWENVKNILNSLLGTDYGESTFRKKYSAFKQMFEANKDLFVDVSREREELEEARRRLEIEKWKFRDERNAWSKQNRIHARTEEKLDLLENKMCDISKVVFPDHPSPAVVGDKSLLVILSDLHIGASFNSYWGSYNTEIAKQRIGDLLEEIKEIANRHKAQECFVVLGGDIISGNIHKNIQITNSENVIDQIKIASEIISSFCYELTNIFKMVTLISVDGNHSRIDKKDDSLHSERLDQLIPYCIDLSLQHVKNFYYCSEANIDTGIAVFPICDKNYVAVHGDYDQFTDAGVRNLVSMIKIFPYAVLFGHRHFPAFSECNGIKMIQNGGLCGTGDQFTVEKRLSGKACQTVCVCSDGGVEAYYPVVLE